MSWLCRMRPDMLKGWGADRMVGDMCLLDANSDPDDEWRSWYADGRLSEAYLAVHAARRAPLLVWLPGRVIFCPDGKTWSSPQGGKTVYSGGWTVTGQAPLITLAPSINIDGTYHGWIKDGTISDDCEGRKYDRLGGLNRRLD